MCLSSHLFAELGTRNLFDTWIIDHLCSERNLTAKFFLFYDKYTITSSSQINCSGQTGWTSTYNDDIIHILIHSFPLNLITVRQGQGLALMSQHLVATLQDKPDRRAHEQIGRHEVFSKVPRHFFPHHRHLLHRQQSFPQD